ncbi:MAG: SGNH/GDSL hydrolase family protein [Pirellulales bacterium]
MWNSLTQYHPRIGFTMMPSVKSRIPWETGGYLVRTNAAGFRSDREFVSERTPGKFRAILFGDSQTAGDGGSNAERYSDVVEKLVPSLEVYNYGLPGTGTDQHYLTYLDCANVDHDLLVIGMHIENIGRIAHRFTPFLDEKGQEVIYAKPYFLMENGELTLHHVPVAKAPLTMSTISAEDAPYVERGVPYPTLRNIVKKLGMRDLAQKITKFQPVPDYDSPDNPKWLLLRKILETWIRGSKTPVLLLLVPMWPFVEGSSDPTNYQRRYRELADETGCFLHDPLPDLWKYSDQERRAFRFKIDSHVSPKGHQAIAASLAPAIERIAAACQR